MGLTKGMKTFRFEVFSKEAIVHCKEFEYTSISIEIARFPKISPTPKYIIVVFHQFCEYIHKGFIHIQQVSTSD